MCPVWANKHLLSTKGRRLTGRWVQHKECAWFAMMLALLEVLTDQAASAFRISKSVSHHENNAVFKDLISVAEVLFLPRASL